VCQNRAGAMPEPCRRGAPNRYVLSVATSDVRRREGCRTGLSGSGGCSKWHITPWGSGALDSRGVPSQVRGTSTLGRCPVARFDLWSHREISGEAHLHPPRAPLSTSLPAPHPFPARHPTHATAIARAIVIAKGAGGLDLRRRKLLPLAAAGSRTQALENIFSFTPGKGERKPCHRA